MKRVRVTSSLQESIARSTARLREMEALEKKHKELIKLQEQMALGISATDKLLAEVERTTGAQRQLKKVQEQIDQLDGRSVLLKAMASEQSAFITIAERLQKQAAEGTLGGLGATQFLVPRIGSVVEQLQLGSALAQADIVGRATDGFLLAEVKRRMEPLGTQHRLTEATLRALRPLSQQEAFQTYLQDLVEQLREAGPQVQEEAEAASERLATAALAEPTPESAYRKFLELLGYLSPIQQFLVRLITNQFFQGLVLVCIAPVVDHYEKQWLQDSPQGQIKQANARVVQEAGGTLVLENFRLVTKDKLEVRVVPAAASKVTATLPLGIHVLRVKGSGAFTLVEWRDGDAVVSGWVFTRYLKKFK